MLFIAAGACSLAMYSICNILNLGACRFLVAFCDDFKQAVQIADSEILSGTHYKRRLKTQNSGVLGDVIRFHCDIQQLRA